MKILISAGPTREYIDPVRFISNPSSGKMGYLLAENALKYGYDVVLVSGPTHLAPPEGVRLVKVETAEEMKNAVMGNFPDAEVLIMSAAVGDWKPSVKEQGKVKRKKSWSLKLEPNPDILKEVAGIKKEHQLVVGFALETENLIDNARRKLQDKKLDLIVADTPDFFAGSQESTVIFMYSDRRHEEFASIRREDVAKKIMERVNKLLDIKR